MLQKYGKPQNQDRRRVFFRPGQVLLLAEHARGYTPEQVIDEIEQKSAVKELLNKAVFEPERVRTFVHGRGVFELRDEGRRPTPGKLAFSLVFVDTDARKPNQLLRLLAELNAAIERDRRQNPDQPLLLRVAAPDWLTTPSPQNAGGGGPGARPVPFTPSEGKPTDIPYHFNISEVMQMLAAEQALQEGGTEQSPQVEVVLLDTVPPCQELTLAYQSYAQHPLLQGLLGSAGIFGVDAKLKISYAGELGIRLPTVEELRVKDHDYEMWDHGLFVAGIIHDLAPNVPLHLYEVLNGYGVGSLEGIATVLQQVDSERRQRAAAGEAVPLLVLNLSLTDVMPLPGHPTAGAEALPATRNSPNGTDQKAIPKEFNDLSLAQEWAYEAMNGEADNGVRLPTVVVAASGNDAIDGKDVDGVERPRARYPAAFEHVIGVGALVQDNSDYAPYSNKPDEPERAGLATFGGNVDELLDMQGGKLLKALPEQAVLGTYIGRFPPDNEGDSAPANNNGWAWWSGTSFAAPQISGLLALMIVNGIPSEVAVNSLLSLSGERISITQGV